MQAARIVARITGTIEPPEPVVQGAMGRLQSACTYTLEGLSSTAALLDATGQAHGFLNAGVLINRERQHAYRNLMQAMERHLDTWVQVTGALQAADAYAHGALGF
jgi:hypothetical protein